MDPTLVSLGKQLIEILVGPVTGSHLFIVSYIVARILEGRVEAGIDPQSIASKLADITELTDDTLNITDSVSV
jgi:hypothetical protein